MKLDAKMVNLLGLLALVVVLGLGALGIVMPLYENVETTQSELDQARDTNENFRMKLVVLTDAETREAEIEKNIAALSAQLPDGAQSDTALKIIADALDLSGAAPASHSFSDAMLFVPRGGDAVDPASAAPAENSGDDAADISNIDPEYLQDLPPDVLAAIEGNSQHEAVQQQQQIDIEMTVNVTGDDMATQFLDALAVGPRSMVVTSATMSEGSEEGYPYDLSFIVSIFYYGTGVPSDE